MERLNDFIGDREPLIVCPSLTENDPNNVLPIWMAYQVGYHLGLNVYSGIYQEDKAHRTGKGGFYRLAHRPSFYGAVRSGQDHLLVDDVLSMGGTLTELRGFIESNGGNVIGMSVLADSSVERRNNHGRSVQDVDLAASSEQLTNLGKKHGKNFVSFWERQTGYEISCLTRREADFLLFFDSFSHIQTAYLEAKNGGSSQSRAAISYKQPAKTP